MDTKNREPRPLIVTVVAIYVAIQLAIAVLNQLVVAQWSELHFQIKFVVILLVGIVLPFCLLRGQRWTRWAVLCVLVIGFATNALELIQHRAEYSALNVGIQLLHSAPSFVLVLSLFHPCCAAWFRGGVRASQSC